MRLMLSWSCKLWSSIGIVGFFLIGFVCSASASQLLVVPKRVFIQANERTGHFTVVNTGNAPKLYKVSLLRYYMDENGSLSKVEDGFGDYFADRFLRFSPRRAIIKPGESQKVRFLVRRPKDLQDGEYRVHVLFSSAPGSAAPVERPTEKTDADKPPEVVAVSMAQWQALSVPLFVYHGKTWTKVAMEKTEVIWTDEGPELALSVARVGNRSPYVNYTVAYTPPGGGKHEVYRVNRVPIYVPLERRNYRWKLRVPDDVKMVSGQGSLLVSAYDSMRKNLLFEHRIDL